MTRALASAGPPATQGSPIPDEDPRSRHMGIPTRGAHQRAMGRDAGERAPRTDNEPIPPFKKVNSDQPSFQASIGGMVVTDPYASSVPWVQTGVDTVDVEIKMLSDFVNEEGQFASNKEVKDKSELFVYLNRYDMGDPRVTDLLIKAHQKGMNVQFITDLSGTTDVTQFDENHRYKDFYKLKPEDFEASKRGAEIAKMMRAGARFSDPTKNDLTPDFGIYGIMYDTRTRAEKPLEHMKGLLLGRKVKGVVTQLWGTDGTGNMGAHVAGGKNPPSRSNRMIIEKEKAYLMNNLNHFEVMRQTYAKGGATSDIPLSQVPPLEIHYPNGNLRRVMFTDGQYNPHDLTALTLMRAGIEGLSTKGSPIDRAIGGNTRLRTFAERMVHDGSIPNKNSKILKVKMKEYLLTNRSIYEGLKLALAANPNLVIEGAVDQQYAGLESQGLIASLMGFESMREFGGNLRGVPPDFYKRVHLHVYQRMVDGKTETSRAESWMSHYLLHDKTIMIWVQEPDGKVKVHIFTKSFNMSSHAENAEELDEIVVDADDPVVKAFEESIDKPIANEPHFYLEGGLAIIRDALARLTGRSEMEVGEAEVNHILDAYHRGDMTEVRHTLEEIARRPSTLTNFKNLTPEKMKARLDRFSRLLDWQRNNDHDLFDQNQLYTLDQRLAGFATIIANQDPLDQQETLEVKRDPYQIYQAMQDLLWKQAQDPQTRQARVDAVWKNELQYGDIPQPPPDDDGYGPRGGGRFGGRGPQGSRPGGPRPGLPIDPSCGPQFGKVGSRPGPRFASRR